jgi:hypothetical protein
MFKEMIPRKGTETISGISIVVANAPLLFKEMIPRKGTETLISLYWVTSTPFSRPLKDGN